MESNVSPIAWLIEKCPNFYFIPSLYYDQIFCEYGKIENKMSCAYWASRNYPVIPLFQCTENEDATHWIVEFPNGRKRGIFNVESVNACKNLDYKIIPVMMIKK